MGHTADSDLLKGPTARERDEDGGLFFFCPALDEVHQGHTEKDNYNMWVSESKNPHML